MKNSLKALTVLAVLVVGIFVGMWLKRPTSYTDCVLDHLGGVQAPSTYIIDTVKQMCRVQYLTTLSPSPSPAPDQIRPDVNFDDLATETP